MHKGLWHDDPLRDRAMTKGDRSLLSSAEEWNRNEGQMTPSELEQEMNRQRAMAGDPGHASIGPPESRMSSIWGHLRHGIPRRVERFLEPETPTEMAGLLGASMYPGVGEAIDVADFAAGLQDRDLGRMGWAAGGLLMPFMGGASMRALLKRLRKKKLPDELLSEAPTRTQIDEIGLSGEADYTQDFLTQGQRPPLTEKEIRAEFGLERGEDWKNPTYAEEMGVPEGVVHPMDRRGIGPTHRRTMDEEGILRPGNWRFGQEQLNRFDDWSTSHLVGRMTEELPESRSLKPETLEEIAENVQDLVSRFGGDPDAVREAVRFPRGQEKIYNKLLEMMFP